jgi:hypothetical protein
MTKLKLITLSVALVASLYFGDRAVAYIRGVTSENARLHTDLIGQTEKYQQLSDHAAKLEIQYSDAAKMKRELESKFAAEKDALQGRIEVLSNATFLIREAARKESKSDVVYQGDKLKYVLNEVRFGNDGPPVGYVLIFDDGRVVSKLYNHEIQVNTAISRDETSGRYSIVSKADYILKSPSLNTGGKVWHNEPYPLDISGGIAYVDPTEKNQLAKRFQLWAPHINGGVSGGASVAGGFLRPSLDVSLAGYGETKNDLDWKFVHVGLDTDSKLSDPGVHVLPFSYRFWPSVLSNTYIGPGIGFTKDGVNGQLNLNLTF